MIEEIEDLLGVEVLRRTTAPRFTRYQFPLSPELEQKGVEAISDELTERLGLPSRVWADPSFLYVEVPRRWAPVTLVCIALKLHREGQVPPCSPVLGLDEESAPLLVNLQKVGHILVLGGRGSGKTELLRTMAASLAIFNKPHDVLLGLIGRGFREFEGLPHLIRPPAVSREAALATLNLALERGKEGGARVVLFIDEGDFPPNLMEQAGVHLVVASSEPILDGYFPLKIVGKGASGRADKLLGQGDFLACFGEQAIRFQAAYVRPEEIEALRYKEVGR